MTSATLSRPARRATSPGAGRRALATAWRASAWLLLLAVMAGGAGLLLFLHRGDAEGGARLANAEIEALLERGERVEHRVPVRQRQWWDWWRVTHGILAATDRRLLYVGVPPAPLLPHGFEPTALVVRAMPYERVLALDSSRAFLGTRPGLQLAAAGAAVSFAYRPSDRARRDSVLSVLARRQLELREAAEAERRATEATLAAARRPIHHLVQRGEALDLIARRYGVSPDSLMAWNALTSPRIVAGRRLLVRPGVE